MIEKFLLSLSTNTNALQVSILITDAHKQINKFLSKQYPEIEHCFDIWHISKG